MQEKILNDSVTKILKICCRNGFFNLQTAKNCLTSIQYGPLGSLFRRNIWREWLSSIINNTDTIMFPIEVMKSGSQLKLKQFSVKSTSSFLPDAFKNYFKMLPVIGMNVPFGFAVYGPVVDLDSELLYDNSLLRKFESQHGLNIIFFCPVKKSSDWFNYWARYRYRWWRKLSSIPSKFSMSEVTETKTGNQQISLMMEFPWGNENLETITLYEENFFKNTCHIMGLHQLKNPVSSLAIIICESELNLAAFAYLSNSFSEKWRDREIRKLFQLHTKLAPYKVCISVNSDDADDLKKLGDVAKHLEKDFKKCQIAVFPSIDTSKKDNISHFSRYDEMGVPYAIVLSKKALTSGIAGLRNRDTTLEEQAHITELTSKLVKYLQMKSFDNAES